MPRSLASSPIFRLGLGCAIASIVLAQASFADAYCRTSACRDASGKSFTGAVCTPAQATDCGKVLFWPRPCVGFSMQKDASVQIDLDAATKIFEQAFDTWMQADCDGAKHPRFTFVNQGPVACDVHEYNKKAGNANIFLFHDDAWPHAGAGSTLALTTVTYNVDTGEIYDADMEINSANVQFTTGDVGVVYDLPSIATHEVGHFLGLSHSPDTTATMYADYMPGDVELRTLAPDDIAGICAIFPPGDAVPADCDPTPRRGLASECSPAPIEAEQTGCCSVAPGSAGSSGQTAVAAVVLAFGLAASRRRERAHRS